jgi:hypothetical protein
MTVINEAVAAMRRAKAEIEDLRKENERLIAATRKLVFAARTSGGIAGHDEALCSALDAVEALLPPHRARMENDELLGALKAARGYMTNAAIDLQTGTRKQNTADMLNRGARAAADAIAKAEGMMILPEGSRE